MSINVKLVISVFLTFLLLVVSSTVFISYDSALLRFEYVGESGDFVIHYARRPYEKLNDKFSFRKQVEKGRHNIEVPLSGLHKIRKIQITFRKNAADDKKSVGFDNFMFYNGYFNKKVSLPPAAEENGSIVIYDENVKWNVLPVVDIKIVIILATVYFMFAYKMVKYLAVFKIEQHHSRIDIVFLTCFFALLFIPMSDISTEESDMKENRTLQKYVPLIKEGKINDDFGKNFEAYFNDRFFGRRHLIKYYERLKIMLSPSEGNANIIIGKNDFLFSRMGNIVKSFQNAELYPDDFLRRVADYLQSINDFCQKNGKSFYFFIAPDKNKIYGENIKYIRKIRPDSESRTFQLIDYLKKHTDVKVIYPYAEIMAVKTADPDDLLYWKYDTHWSEKGAYIGYLALMKEINKDVDVPKVKIKSWEKYVKKDGDLARMLEGYPKVDTEYEKPLLFEQNFVCNRNELDVRNPMFCTNPKGKKRVVLFHDSFTINMQSFLAETFAKSSFFWRYPQKSLDIDWLLQNADIVILENVEKMVQEMNEY